MAQVLTRPQIWEDTGALWRLAWPAVALNGLQTINSLLDNWFVQRLSPEALTAIGAATNAVFLFISLSMAFGTASTAMVARMYGARDEVGLKEAARRCLGFSMSSGVVFAIVAILTAPLAAQMFIREGNHGAQHLMAQYLAAFAVAIPAVFTVQSLAGALRGIGDTVSPMVISGIQILLHMTFNYLFMFPSTKIGAVVVPGLGLGLPGAGWALCASGWVAAIGYLLWCRKTGLGPISPVSSIREYLSHRSVQARMHHVRTSFSWVKRIALLALPAATTNVVRVISLMVLTKVLTHVPGSDFAIGGMRPGFTLESLAFMPPFGLAIAAASLVGQSLGAGDAKRAERIGWLAAHCAGAVALLAVLIMFPNAEAIAGWLLHDQPSFVPFTASYLRFICLTEVFFAYSMVFVSAIQGAGDTVRPLWLTVIVTLVIRTPLAALLALTFHLGADGVWMSMALSQLVVGIGSVVLWMQGKWKLARV